MPPKGASLPVGEAQADAFKDLQTKSNKLSVWVLDAEKSNLERLIAALSANRDRLGKFDYALFDQNLIEQLQIKSTYVEGDTPDFEANKWHMDLEELTTKKLFQLTEVIQENQKNRCVKVKELINDSIKAGNIDPNNINETIKTKLEVPNAGERGWFVNRIIEPIVKFFGG